MAVVWVQGESENVEISKMYSSINLVKMPVNVSYDLNTAQRWLKPENKRELTFCFLNRRRS